MSVSIVHRAGRTNNRTEWCSKIGINNYRFSHESCIVCSRKVRCLQPTVRAVVSPNLMKFLQCTTKTPTLTGSSSNFALIKGAKARATNSPIRPPLDPSPSLSHVFEPSFGIDGKHHRPPSQTKHHQIQPSTSSQLCRAETPFSPTNQ